QRDGIAFWLKTQDGTLFHHSEHTFRRLFKLQPDTWYVVDVVLHVQAGTYDLRIVTPRAPDPLVLLEQQPNAINTPGSQLAKISFIGDLEDRSSVHYFVDDVELRVLSTPLHLGGPTRLAGTASTTTAPRAERPRDFILSGAPSSPRRTYFDEYLEIKQLEASLPQCLPATTLRDFSLTRKALTDNPMLREDVRQAMKVPSAQFATPPTFVTGPAAGIFLWRRGCHALHDGNVQDALADLAQGLTLLPEAPIVQAAYAIAAN